jgi:hypothetical protein
MKPSKSLGVTLPVQWALPMCVAFRVERDKCESTFVVLDVRVFDLQLLFVVVM